MLATRLLPLAFTAALSVNPLSAQQQQLPWKEGNVIEVTFIRTKPGKFNDYVRYLMGPYKQIQDGLKQSGVILDWQLTVARTASPEEPDLVIYTTYGNMAAFDNINERSEAVLQRVQGSMQQRDQMTADRESLRTVIGSRLIRQLVPR